MRAVPNGSLIALLELLIIVFIFRTFRNFYGVIVLRASVQGRLILQTSETFNSLICLPLTMCECCTSADFFTVTKVRKNFECLPFEHGLRSLTTLERIVVVVLGRVCVWRVGGGGGGGVGMAAGVHNIAFAHKVKCYPTCIHVALKLYCLCNPGPEVCVCVGGGGWRAGVHNIAFAHKVGARRGADDWVREFLSV